MPYKDYYKILGIDRNAPTFSFREITSNLDLSRIREIKPMAPEGQPSASRL